MNDALLTLWIVGRYMSGEYPSVCWEFVGVFSTMELAVNACTAKEYFYARIEVDDVAPRETTLWGGVIYPMVPV